MKTILPLLVLITALCSSSNLHAQSPNVQSKRHLLVQLDPLRDKLEYNGYSIRLIPTIDGYYGYDITKGGKMIVHQFQNPLPGSGLSNREDAFAVAEWMTEQYIKTGHVFPVIPPDIQKQLKLTSSH